MRRTSALGPPSHYRVYVTYVRASAERRPQALNDLIIFTPGLRRTYPLLLAHAFGPLGLSFPANSLGRP